MRQATNDIARESQAISEVKILANTAASEEIARLKQQNEELSRLLDRGRVDAEKAKDELVKRVSGLLADFLNERQVFLRTTIEDVQAETLRPQSHANQRLKNSRDLVRHGKQSCQQERGWGGNQRRSACDRVTGVSLGCE